MPTNELNLSVVEWIKRSESTYILYFMKLTHASFSWSRLKGLSVGRIHSAQIC